MIVTTNTPFQQQFWKHKLANLRGIAYPTTSKVIVIYEDWPGGAGSGLGTLYAFQKAATQASLNLLKMQEDGATIAIYHTAGKGKRLAPLSLSEYNNKSAVTIGGKMTMLEAVIRKSAPFAHVHKGRLLVFWGDQLFVPSIPITPPTHAIEVFCKSAPTPTEESWKRDQLDQYGIISSNNEHLDKMNYSSFCDRTASLPFSLSLGSFSLSAAITRILLDTFAKSLTQKNERKDVEAHLWMPLTLPWDTYQKLYPEAKQVDYNKMQSIKTKIQTPLYRGSDIGADAFWWDFGNLHSYYENHMSLLKSTEKSNVLRDFFQLGDTASFRNNIKSGKVQNSFLIGVQADHLDVKDCVIMNSKFTSLTASKALIYKAQDHTTLTLKPESVRSDLIRSTQKTHHKLYFDMNKNSKNAWSSCFAQNTDSFEDLYQQNLNLNPLKEGL